MNFISCVFHKNKIRENEGIEKSTPQKVVLI
jgi:hypothetical protein